MDYITAIISRYEADLQSVKEDGYDSLKYVKEQTPELCFAAVKNNICSLKFVNKQTPELCLAAVKKDASSIQLVKEQTNELCLIALKNNPWCFQHVITMSEEMWRLAVKKDGRILFQIKDIELKLQLTREITNELSEL
jgi:hypothetical protein